MAMTKEIAASVLEYFGSGELGIAARQSGRALRIRQPARFFAAPGVPHSCFIPAAWPSDSRSPRSDVKTFP
jgi:hypothetical protein